MAPVYGMLGGLYAEPFEERVLLGAEIPLAITAHWSEKAIINLAGEVFHTAWWILTGIFIRTAEHPWFWRTQDQNDIRIG
jgi:hypothetical protein